MYISKYGQSWSDVCLAILLFSLFCSTLVIPDGFGGFAALLLLFCSIGLLVRRLQGKPNQVKSNPKFNIGEPSSVASQADSSPAVQPLTPLNKWEKYWLFALALFFASNVLSILVKPYDQWEWTNLDVPLRFLLVIPVFLYLRKAPGHPAAFWVGIVLGAVAAGSYALYQKIAQHSIFATGAANHHIVFGDVALTLGFLSLLSKDYFQRYRWGWVLPLLGFLGGLIGSVLSGARGGWIAVPLLAVLFLWYYRDRLSLVPVLLGTVLTVGACISAYHAPATNIKARIMTAIHETQAYLRGENFGGSLPQRYEMFKSAWLMFMEKPILGVGTDAYPVEVKRLWQEGKVQRIGHALVHPHNDYLSALAMRGAVGFFSLMLLFALPIFYLWPLLSKAGVKLYAMAGITVNVAYMQFALSEAILDRMLSLMFYLFVMAVIFSFVRVSIDASQGSNAAQPNEEASG